MSVEITEQSNETTKSTKTSGCKGCGGKSKEFKARVKHGNESGGTVSDADAKQYMAELKSNEINEIIIGESDIG